MSFNTHAAAHAPSRFSRSSTSGANFMRMLVFGERCPSTSA